MLFRSYDSNKISIEGDTDVAFTEDVQKKFEAFGFNNIVVEDGNDIDAIAFYYPRVTTLSLFPLCISLSWLSDKYFTANP